MSEVLQISPENIQINSPIISLGVDSLVAVEIRAWLLRALDADIAVLNILGGLSIADLCELVAFRLRPDLIQPSPSVETTFNLPKVEELSIEPITPISPIYSALEA